MSVIEKKQSANTAPKHKVKKEEEVKLNGTLVSVMLLGLFIVLSWGGIYLWYLSRF
ncbi:cytochrome c oxidase subunit 2A [Pseudalkalibacillus caeni]|uniref:Cytochrome c oxidase subunit 2A n=1 Tax=Exobacillus caeni TaxID=2574798 RepID=A0A5R9FDM8_9BACL|nr:cytochrome c oxidase subunit 2A [Pseudalkalibacillus caeni]TLS38983.1 cytochrome c oxidase subunit 2A [Pseudalkalibacillus caeni]